MLKNIFKGFIIGVGKIIPGVSGSLLAIMLGVYERCLAIISNVRKIKVNDIIFLVTLAVGVFLGISIFSRVINWFLTHFYFLTIVFFAGLIISGILEIGKDVYGNIKKSVGAGGKNKTFNFVLIFMLSLLFSYWLAENGLGFLLGEDWVKETDSSINLGGYFVLGIIEAFSSIVPGISGTAIFMSLGCYDLLLDFFANIFNIYYWRFGLFFFLGVVVGVYGLAKVITFLLKKFRNETYMAILGFMVAAVGMMIEMAVLAFPYEFVNNNFILYFFEVFKGFVWAFVGIYLGKKINNLLSND